MKPLFLPHQHGEKHIATLYRNLSQIEPFSVVAEIFRQLGDTTRIRIFWLLCHQEECVINIAALLNLSSSTTSHHLRSLHECGLLSSRRDGKEVYYRVANTEESKLLHLAMEQMMELTCPETIIDLHTSQEELIHIIHRYLMEHLSERITIEALSRLFLINPTSLKQGFKRVYGTSIAAHMKEHRMKQAAHLLLECEDTIAQIASSVGYESPSRFTAAFKNMYGMLPTEYRKQITVQDSSSHNCLIP